MREQRVARDAGQAGPSCPTGRTLGKEHYHSLMNERSYVRSARKQPGRSKLRTARKNGAAPLLSFSSHCFFSSGSPRGGECATTTATAAVIPPAALSRRREPTTSGMPAPSLLLVLCKIEHTNPSLSYFGYLYSDLM
jgi:hypothetical protein